MLKDLIDWLEEQNPNLTVTHGFGEPDSYRGYYQDVAFEPKENVTFGEMLGYARSALGKTFTGYKGGEFTMHDFTDCWIAQYGTSEGDKIGPTLKAIWLATAH